MNSRRTITCLQTQRAEVLVEFCFSGNTTGGIKRVASRVVEQNKTAVIIAWSGNSCSGQVVTRIIWVTSHTGNKFWRS